MKKPCSFIIIQFSIMGLLFSGCSIQDKVLKLNNEFAMNNRMPVKFIADGKEFIGIIDSVRSESKTTSDSDPMQTITYIDQRGSQKTLKIKKYYIQCPMYPPNATVNYYAVINGSDSKDETITITGVARSTQYPVLTLKSNNEFEMLLIDDSLIIGRITNINLNTGAITLESNINKWTITPDKIKKLYVPVTHVRIIFRDGASRYGELVSDSGNIIVMKTIVGIERFDRSVILKIEYIKK